MSKTDVFNPYWTTTRSCCDDQTELIGGKVFGKNTLDSDDDGGDPYDEHEEDEEGGRGGEGRRLLIALPEQHTFIVFQGCIFTQTGQLREGQEEGNHH